MGSLEVTLELAALTFRQTNCLTQTESLELKSLLQKNRILSVFLPLRPEFSGLAIKLNGEGQDKFFLLINSSHTIGRQNFTICHEFYHLYLQDGFHSEISNAGRFDTRNPDEYKADIFASCLLLPRDGVLQMIPEKERHKDGITLKTILEIENYFSCSRQTLLIRLKNMGYVTQQKISEYSSEIIHNAILYGYNGNIYRPGNENLVIGDYGSSARELFDRGIVSESSYFSLLEDIGIDLAQLDSLSQHE